MSKFLETLNVRSINKKIYKKTKCPFMKMKT